MAITVTNQDVLIRLPKERLDAIGAEFERALQDEATRLVIRTRQGTDVSGQPFRPYTPEYADRRQKKGRSPSPVDLTFTGQMLAAIQTRVERVGQRVVGTVYVNSAAQAVKAAANNRTRRFFEFSAEQIQRLVNRLKGAK